MSLRSKWFLISVGGGFLTSVGLLLLTKDPVILLLPAPGTIPKLLLWPVAAMVHLAGPGPSIGPPERHMHEWTPVHDIAVAVGLGLTLSFYSSILFIVLWVRKRLKGKVRVRPF